MPINQTSGRAGTGAGDAAGGLDLLLQVRKGEGALHLQVETALRDAITAGTLTAGTALPASRTLAAQLGVSRSVVTEAYSQLQAEGFLTIAPRSLPRVTAGSTATPGPPAPEAPLAHWRLPPAPHIRYDLRPGSPALDQFPRKEWLRSVKLALDELKDEELDYPAPEGMPWLRATLAAYLGRVRGVRSDGPIICGGVSQSTSVACAALRASGRATLAVEDPGHPGVRDMIAADGMQVVPVPVDEEGLIVEAIPPQAGAVLVTPAHQYPTGVVLSPARRHALIAWARANDTYVLEDDYDAEFRYDRTAVGTLQGLAPDRVVAMSSVSKTLAPALRLGWLTPPPGLSAELVAARHAIGHGLGAIEQHALAGAIERGAYDRHIRRVRRVYRERHDLLVAALGQARPDLEVGGVAAGLHLTLTLDRPEADALEAAARHGVHADAMQPHRITSQGDPALVLGYGRLPAPAVRSAVRALAQAL